VETKQPYLVGPQPGESTCFAQLDDDSFFVRLDCFRDSPCIKQFYLWTAPCHDLYEVNVTSMIDNSGHRISDSTPVLVITRNQALDLADPQVRAKTFKALGLEEHGINTFGPGAGPRIGETS